MEEPFLGSEALAAGRLTRHQVRTKFVPVHQDVYVSPGTELTPMIRAKACWLRSRRRGVLVGFSASAVHGARWISRARPAEINDTNHKPTRGVIARGGVLEDDEVCRRFGMAATTPERTALDLLCWYPADTAIAAVDSLARATRLKIADVELLAERHRGRRGIKSARAALELVDAGAESPRETWLRLLITRSGFPRPQTQLPVYNEYGALIAEVDMGYEDRKIAFEYEGDHHRTDRTQFTKDIRRYEALTELGWIVIRVTAEDAQGDIIRRTELALARQQ
jgi:very-short-patch-repair endonuclease